MHGVVGLVYQRRRLMKMRRWMIFRFVVGGLRWLQFRGRILLERRLCTIKS
jgi:hypothetical protein